MSEVDLSEFELHDTATMEVLTKNGEPMLWEGKPVSVEFWGPGTQQANAWETQSAREQTKRAMQAARGKMQDSSPHKDAVDRVCAMTKQIINLPVTPQQLFGNRKMLHVLGQAQQFLADNANF